MSLSSNTQASRSSFSSSELQRPILTTRNTSRSYGSSRTSAVSFPTSSGSRTPREQDSAPAKSTNGLRAHINHLLPKHALFYVSVHIHEISSVPLVNGEFGASWRFRNVQQVHSLPLKHQEALAALKERLHSSDNAPHATEKERPKTRSAEEILQRCLDIESSVTGSLSETSTPPPIPSLIVSEDSLHRTISVTSDCASVSSPSSTSRSTSFSDAHQSTTEFSRSDTPSTEVHGTRGMTAYLPLREHRVKWEHHVEAVIKLDVNRDTHELLEHNLKLSIKQHVIPGDPSMLSNPRLGVVYVNLAEYADEGPVTRRHLLADSRTNATLKLTIHVEHLESDKTKYTAPPLPKADILGGIHGLLDESAYNDMPRRLRAAARDRAFTERFGSNSSFADIAYFDAARLPYAIGPKSTEALIEAIFNPLPTRDKVTDPFTYYEPPIETPPEKNKSFIDSASMHSTETASSTSDWVRSRAPPSLASNSSSNTSDEVVPKHRWWKPHRPSTPASAG